MSGKRSIPKPKPKPKPKKQMKDFVDRINDLQKQCSEINTNLIAHRSKCAADYIHLNEKINLLHQQVINIVEWSDKVAKMFHYNQILPEPEKRWVPAVVVVHKEFKKGL